MKNIKWIIIVVFFTACQDKPVVTRIGLLHGMYKLHIIEMKDSAGKWYQQEWGKGGDGYILYDGNGHMGVHITPKGYKDFPWLDEESAINNETVSAKTDSMKMDELKSAVKEFSSSYVYFGNYSVDDTANVITHYRITGTIPAVWGTTVKRKFTFSGDTVILEPVNGNRRLKWIKMK